jgi:hypothetical protein
MKLSPVGLFVVAVLLSSHGALAFTIDNSTGNNSNGNARFSDPDALTQRLTTPSDGDSPTKTFRFGNSPFSLSIGRSDDRSDFGLRSPSRGFGVSPFSSMAPRRPD